MALKDWGTDILAYKIHKDICASNNYFHKRVCVWKGGGGVKQIPVNLLTDVCQRFCITLLCIQKHHMSLQCNVFY